MVRVSTAASIVAAVRGMVSGRTVVIEAGEYELPATLHVTRGLHDVAIRGATGVADDVVLRGPGMGARSGPVPHGVLIGRATDVLVADLTIRGVPYHAVQVQGEQGAERVRLYGLHLVDAGEQFVKVSTAGPPGPYSDDGIVACSTIEYADRAPSDYTNGVDVLAGRGWTVRDNVFRRIRAPVGDLAGPAVLMWRNSIDSRVERNLFLECDRGIALGLAAPDPALARDGESTYDHQSGVVRNNIFRRGPDSATGDIGISINYARDAVVVHNTVIQNGTFAFGAIEYRFPVTTALVRDNLTDAPVWRRDGARAEVRGNITGAEADWFVDEAAGDLHLVAGAPPVDASRASPEVTDDFDGQPRPYSSGADTGADEWYPQAPPAASATPTAMATAIPTATATAKATSGSTPTPGWRVFLPAATG